MHTQHIRAVKFPMPPKDHYLTGNDMVFELQELVQTQIMIVLVVLDLKEGD